MKQRSYWNEFIGTGAVEDYLRYKTEEQPERLNSSGKFGREDYPDARSCYSNRNCAEDHSCG